jgi:hypothetical protein
MVLDAKDEALKIGISVDRFWNMTYLEAAEEINAYYKRRDNGEKRQEQIRALMDYQLAQLIGTIVHDPKHYPDSLDAAYPELFKEKRKPENWKAQKADFALWAAEFNRRRGEKH